MMISNTLINKTFFILGILMMSGIAVMAQSGLTIEGTQLISSYKFKDSNANKDKSYIPVVAGGYSIGYLHDTGNGLVIHPRIGMRSGGATMMHEGSNYLWETQYVDLKVGLGYSMDMGRFSPYATLSPYFAVLLKGNQVLNNQNYDLVKTGSMKSTDFGFFFSPGVKTALNDLISAYLEVSYFQGLSNIDTDVNGQKAVNIGAGATLGLTFNITQLSGGGE